MRKTAVHIFFLGMMLSTCLANAIALPQNAEVTAALQKAASDTIAPTDIFRTNSIFHKNDLLSDFDDYDDCDYDDHTTSLDKGYSDSISLVKNNPLKKAFISKLVFHNSYTFANFSRLPRFNYISLRTLLL